MDAARPVFLFRSGPGPGGRDAVSCVAPADLVVAAYGGGGHHDQDGLRQAFGGGVFFRNDETGAYYLGVWGARNASRFRTALRRKATIAIVREPPPARLVFWSTGGNRPPSSMQRGVD